MKRIFPSHAELGRDELVEAYAYPSEAADTPWVRASMITSLDGAAQGADRRSGSLSSPADKRVFAMLRTLCDVILVGAGTARAEKYSPVEPSPAFAAHRGALGQRPTPPIAVVSGRLDVDPDGPLFSGRGEPTFVLTTMTSPPERRAELAPRAEVLVVGEDRVDLPRALDALAARGLNRVLCEGGPLLLGQIVADGLLDDLCLTFAPMLRGGGADRALNGPPVPDVPMRLVHILEEDGNLITRWVRAEQGSTATDGDPGAA